MRASRAWARTWPGARGEPLLVSTRDARCLPAGSTIRCAAPGCVEVAKFEVVVMRRDLTTFTRAVCGAFGNHPRTRSAA